jgi:hypothetical protein
MSAISQARVDSCEVVRCVDCDLMQFVTLAGSCPRCARNLGSTAAPWEDVFIGNASGNTLKLTGTFSANRTLNCCCFGPFFRLRHSLPSKLLLT